jgi:cytochrome c oxidase subunit 2
MRPNIVEQVDATFILIVTISVILLLLVTICMIYFIIKYNKKRNPVPANIHGSTALEIIWTAIPIMLVLGMFFSGYASFKNMRNVPDDAFVVHVTARMWQWSFEYPNGKKSDTLYVPLSKPIKAELTSNDVNHSFYIPAMREKEDVIPGRTNYMWFQPTSIGSYYIECAEYCGLNHSRMLTKLVVMNDDVFDKWYNFIPPAADTTTIKKDTTLTK